MRETRRVRAMAVIVGVALALAACGGGTHNDTAASRPSSPATIAIVNPAPGAVVSGGKVVVELDLKGGRVIDESRPHSDVPQSDEGHIHVTVDGRLVQMNYALTSEIAAAPGSHVLEAEFVAADHAPFSPRVLATTTFQMQ